MSRLTLSTLGPLQVTLDGKPVTGFESNKVRALLAYLVVEAGRPHSRDALCELLWPDQPGQTAHNNLRQALANLRRTLGDTVTQELPFLRVDRESVQFDTESRYWLDMTEFNDLFAACSKHSHRRAEACRSCAKRLQAATSIYRGDFLEQFYVSGSAAFEEWAALKREWLRRLALDALYRLADHFAGLGMYEESLAYAARQLRLDTWREEAHCQVMRALACNGQRSSALAQYELCRRVLAAELCAEPSAETMALRDRIRGPASGTPGRDLPCASPQPMISTLPLSPTRFIGREAELAAIMHLLEDPGCGLVTLTGPGGIGKTRLAMQAALENAHLFAGGVFYVSLVSCSSLEALSLAIARSIGCPFTGRQDTESQLVSHLSHTHQDILLVLDDFEHSLPETALLAEILRRTRRVSLLVTSRERLNIQGEWVIDVAGLPFPARDALAGPEPAQFSALDLFLETARRARPGFAPTGQEIASVAHICRLAEGMPLAIELAAGWVRMLSCQEIVQEIQCGLDLLTTSLRDVPGRHRSIRAVFEASWHLLTAEERGVLRRMSVFSGGFPVAAVEFVAGAPPSLLASLVDRSFLRRDSTGRYTLHELMRQFARERLFEAHESEQAYSDQLAWLTTLALEAERHFRRPDEQRWLDQLEAENDNLRIALAWAVEGGQALRAARVGAAVWRFWYDHGYLREGRKWLEQMLVGAEALPVPMHAELFSGAGALAYAQGDYPGALAFWAKCLALQEDYGNRRGVAHVLNRMGLAATEQCDYPRGKELCEQSLALFRALDDEAGMTVALNNLANVAYGQGNHAAAAQLHEESLALARQRGDQVNVATALANLGWTALFHGDSARAAQLCQESLALFRDLGNRAGMAFCLEGLAGVAGAQAQPVRAARAFGAAEALREIIGSPLSPANLPYYQQLVAVVQTQLDAVRLAAEWAVGRTMTPNQAVAYVQLQNGLVQ